MGIDDLVAILNLLNRQDVELIAVTINGNSACHSIQGASNALKLLHLTAIGADSPHSAKCVP
jgi:inosine-uridine nucleoside N-ribohydrolase